MPPSYAYHLTFELYSTPIPACASDDDGQLPLWRPGPGASVFDDLPWHYTLESGSDNDHSERSGSSEAKKPTGERSDSDKASAGHERGENTSSERSGDKGRRRHGKSAAHNEHALERQQQSTFDPDQPSTSIFRGLGPETAPHDWRFGRVRIASVDMDMDHHVEEGPAEARLPGPAASLGPVLGGAGQATRGRYNPLATKMSDAGWGIVHLYREGGGPAYSNDDDADDADYADDTDDGSDGTILCIPAVPSYLTPRDFLGFVGEKWIGDVSHFRMIMTSRTNRYMVLLKLRDRARATEWRAAFEGRVFNSIEAEVCHVAFIKSISIETAASLGSRARSATVATTTSSSVADPAFRHRAPSHSSGKDAALSRPLPPPTANLIELPTCPVCLERMDDTAGIMTIMCQHVFHCTCLQTWKGSGCPVCRATNPLPISSNGDGSGGGDGRVNPDDPYARPFGAGGVSNLCSVCDCADDLWICLICGNVGCGRYKGGHAKEHWKETMHSFSLELETQHVWDYAGDTWVHRLIRDKGDGKIVELPGRSRRNPRSGRGGGGSRSQRDDNDDNDDDDDVEDVVPRAKLDRIGFEYTHLITSQLESQRLYFEEMVNKAADKAAAAVAAAERAAAQTAEARSELQELRGAHATLTQVTETTVPSLERDVDRERRRADKAAELARGLGRSLQDEKRVSEGLMTRIRHVQEQLTDLQGQLAAAQAETAELREANRDLTMFISGQEKLRELEAEGQVAAGEIEEGTASVPEDKRCAKGKGKGKGRRK